MYIHSVFVPLQMVIFPSYVNVYQRVYLVLGNAEVTYNRGFIDPVRYQRIAPL